MPLFAELRARAWQAGTIAASVTALGLAVALGVTTLQKNRAEDRADRLHDQIHAPVNGYIAQVARCKANTTALDGALQRQNRAMDDLRASSAARLERTTRELATAQRTAAEYRAEASRLARATPVGVTQCDRILDVDAMVKEAFQ